VVDNKPYQSVLYEATFFRNDGVQAGVRILEQPDSKEYPSNWSRKAVLHTQARKFACGKKYKIHEISVERREIS
jgi:hypothetical protein